MMNTIITREEALSQIRAFAAVVNNGAKTSQNEWDYINELMKQFNITIEEVNK